MTDLESSFTQLLGRQASDREKQDLYRARDALNLKDNDAVWLLLMALGHYETLYAKVPAMMAKAAGDVTAAVQKAAEAQVKATVARVHADLGAAVAQTAARDRRPAHHRAEAAMGGGVHRNRAGCAPGGGLVRVPKGSRNGVRPGLGQGR